MGVRFVFDVLELELMLTVRTELGSGEDDGPVLVAIIWGEQGAADGPHLARFGKVAHEMSGVYFGVGQNSSGSPVRPDR